MIVKELTRTDFKETMVLKADQERVKTLIRDTVTLLCKNGLEFRDKFSLEALIGVTLDEGEVVLLSINELVQADGYAQRSPAETSPAHTSPRKRRKRSRSGGQVKAEVSESDGGEELVFVKEELVADQTWPEVSTEYADPVAEASSAAGIPGTSFSSAMVDMNLLESNQQQTEWVSQGSDGSYGNTATTTVTMASAGQQGTMATTGSQDDMTGQLSGDPLDQQQQILQFPRSADRKWNVEIQLDQETKIRKRICQYENCQYTTYHRSAMSRHQRIHNDKYHVCSFCGKKYVEKYDLSAHIAAIHESNGMMCKYCGKTFTSRSGLVLHEKKHQDADAPCKFNCQFCGKGYDRIHNYRNHLEQHPEFTNNEAMKKELEDAIVERRNTNLLKKDKQPYSRFCPVEGCNYSSKYRSSMIRHQKRAHNKDYMKCPYCQRRFVEKYDLRCHIESAHEGKPTFSCDKCGQAMATKGSLQSHLENDCKEIGNESTASDLTVMQDDYQKLKFQQEFEELLSGLKVGIDNPTTDDGNIVPPEDPQQSSETDDDE